MSSTALKTLAVILVVAAAILGFAAYYLSQGLTRQPDTAQPQTPQPAEDQVLAVVAVQRVSPYQPITPESVALLPISVKPPQYFTDVGDVVGRTPMRSIPVGAPVTEDSFGAPNSLAQAIPSDAQAMSLEISDVVAVGGFVQPGDLVDVLVYLRASGSEVEDSQARVLLENARVLAYEERLINVDDQSGSEGSDSRQQRRQRTAVLAVPENDTTRVMLGASMGELRLALRGDRQTAQVAGATAAQDDGAGAPEAIAPAADGSTGSEQAAGESDEDEKDEPKVITLRELAEIKDKKAKQAKQRQAPPQASIEVYRGTESQRINRPY